jgi:hypothetical protein
MQPQNSSNATGTPVVTLSIPEVLIDLLAPVMFMDNYLPLILVTGEITSVTASLQASLVLWIYRNKELSV